MSKDKADKPKTDTDKFAGSSRWWATVKGALGLGVIGMVVSTIVSGMADLKGKAEDALIMGVAAVTAIIGGWVANKNNKKQRDQFEHDQKSIGDLKAQNAALESDLVKYRTDHGKRIMEARESGVSQNSSVSV